MINGNNDCAKIKSYVFNKSGLDDGITLSFVLICIGLIITMMFNHDLSREIKSLYLLDDFNRNAIHISMLVGFFIGIMNNMIKQALWGASSLATIMILADYLG